MHPDSSTWILCVTELQGRRMPQHSWWVTAAGSCPAASHHTEQCRTHGAECTVRDTLLPGVLLANAGPPQPGQPVSHGNMSSKHWSVTPFSTTQLPNASSSVLLSHPHPPHTHASRAHGGKTRRGISCTGLLLQASSPTSRGGMSSPLQVGCCYHVQYRPPKRGPRGIRSAPQPVQHYAECLAQTQEDHVLLVLQQHGRCQNSVHTDPNQCHPRNPTAEAQLLTSPVFDHPYQAQVSISSISKLHPLHKRWLP